MQQAIGVAIAATERRDYKGAHALFKLIYDAPGADSVPVTGLSFYGLCVLKVERKAGRAIELADTARAKEFYDSRHWANLARIYLESGSRRRAVSTLAAGLKQMPGDQTLLKFRDEIGYRQGPPIGFLHRDNPLNVFFGKRPDILHPPQWVKIAIAIVWFIALMALTFYFLMKNSGF